MRPALAVLLLVSCASTPHYRDPLPAQAASAVQAPGVIDIKDIDEANLGPVTRKFDQLVSGGATEVFFRINSYGGSVTDGYDFIQHVEDSKKRNGVSVKCVVDMRAMSMGFAILQAVCDERWMTRRSLLLAHQVSTKTRGNADDLQKILDELKAYDRALAEICAARLRISVLEYMRRTAGRDWTMAWEEAFDVGAIDGVMDPRDVPAPYELEAENPLGRLLRLLTR